MDVVILIITLINVAINSLILYELRKKKSEPKQEPIVINNTFEEEEKNTSYGGGSKNPFGLVNDYLNGKGDLFNEKDTRSRK